jgi:CarD family transcriptional regulator
VTKALTTLKGRARIKRTMWSRRAQEYEAKINSGDLISIAEVVRDLHRADSQPEQSYSERQLYESALDRMAREVAAANRIDKDAAVQLLSKSLSAKKAVIAAAEAAEDAAEEAEAA